MSPRGKPLKSLSDHPVVVAIGVVAAIATIVACIVLVWPLVRPTQTDRLINVLVSDDQGAPVPAAKTLLFYAEEALSSITDSNGISTFVISESEADQFRLIVEAEGYQISQTQFRSKDDKALTVLLEKPEDTAASVILRVMDESQSIPVPGAEIILVSQGEKYSDKSDSDGFSKFDLTLPGDATIDARLSVSAKNYELEDQIISLQPDKLQYVLLSPDTLTIETPNIRTSRSTTTQPNTVSDVVEVGSGVEIGQEDGNGLRLIVLGPNGEPWENFYLQIYAQVPDASGNPSRGDFIAEGRINKQGIADFALEKGTYIICPQATQGYGWTTRDCIYEIDIRSDSLTTLKLQPGQLEVAIVGATGEPWGNVYYQVYSQVNDVSGNPVSGSFVAEGRTDNTGRSWAWLTPGMYILRIDLNGYNWGNLIEAEGEFNIPIEHGKTTQKLIKMGRLVLGLKNLDGSPNVNAYWALYTQKTAVDGSLTLGDFFQEGRTDNAGYSWIDLTKGKYALKIGEQVLLDIPIEWGKVTETDGETITQK